jgi:phosphate-selective porin OprO and OprP
MQNPSFSGFYVTGSYVITGENRPYDRKAAFARRIIPKSRWGAVEVVGRYSHLDLDDKSVKGGYLKKYYAGLNWWISPQWHMSIGSDLNRSNTIGHTNALQLRMQWIY